MKKIMAMLLFAAATMNVLAVDFTAQAVITLSDGSSTCDLTVAEAEVLGALSGSEMNMDNRAIALYALKGSTKLQVATAANLNEVQLGLKSNASTEYTITPTSVIGTLYIYDKVKKENHLLAEGVPFTITDVTPNSTDELRLVLRKAPTAAPTDLDVCFNDNKLIINANPYSDPIVITSAGGDEIDGSPFPASTLLIDLKDVANGKYIVEFADGKRKFVVVKQ